MSSNNFYEVLDTDADASPEDIRKAYRKKALQTHPDRLPQGATTADKEAAEDRFRKVNNAYEVLIDPKSRKQYDLYGVWPPPEEYPDERRRPRGDRSGYPSSHYPYPPGPFDDPFFNSPNFGDPFARHRPPPPAFAFRDPFDLFNAMFADMQRDFHRGPASMMGPPAIDPFAFRLSPPILDPFHPRYGRTPFSSFPTLFDDDAFPDDHRGSSSRPNGSQNFSFQSSSRGRYAPGPDSQEPQWVSESKMVRTVNGVTQTIYKKKDGHGNEHVTKIYPDGREKYTVNGVEQRQSSRHIRDAPPSGDLRRPSADSDSSHPPIIPPEPEAGASKKRWWGRH